MVAYNGGPMRVNAWDNPVVIDLQGLERPNRKVPVLKDHDAGQLVGHTTKIEVMARSIRAEGKISGNTEAADQVSVMGQREFPWQASVGLAVTKVEFVGEGESAVVNGRRVDGPVDIARKATFREISFVAWGADSTTTASVAAKQQQKGQFAMWEEIVLAMGLDPNNITDEQRNTIEAIIAAKGDPNDSDDTSNDDSTDAGGEKKPATKLRAASDSNADPATLMRAQAATEIRRITAIQAQFCDFPELAAKAIEEGWDSGRCDSELRAAKAEKLVKDRAGAGIDTFNVSVKTPNNASEVIEAAICMSGRMVSPERLLKPLEGTDPETRQQFGRIVKPISQQQLDAADEQFRGMGLQELCLWAARVEGKYSGWWGDGERALKAAFSTVVLPTVFQNIANRALLEAYGQVSTIWPKIARPRPARDFRDHTFFRVHGSGRWQKIGQGSELKHGMMGEGLKYTSRLSTDGQMLTLTREDYINDDVGALADIASMMAQYGTLAPELGCIEALLENAGSFFSAGNNNLKTGAGSVFGPDGLKDLYTLFLKRKDGKTLKDSRDGSAVPYISIQPEVLVVPPELFVSAFEMTNSSVLQSGGSTRQATSNFFANRFGDVVQSPYLSDTAVHANASGTAFYLFARPTNAAAITMLFLNGNTRPTVQSVALDSSIMGTGFRGYIDYSATLGDYNAVAKSAGV